MPSDTVARIGYGYWLCSDCLIPARYQNSNWLQNSVDSELELAMATLIDIFDGAHWLCRYMCPNCKAISRSNQNSNWLWPPLSTYLTLHIGFVDTCARIAKPYHVRIRTQIGYGHPYRHIWRCTLVMSIHVRELQNHITFESELKLAMTTPIDIFDDAHWFCRYMCPNCKSISRWNQNSNWLWPPLSTYLTMHIGYVDTRARNCKTRSCSNHTWNPPTPSAVERVRIRPA